MIYEFIDESLHLHLTERPAEAMQFNGHYLEDLVTGYKTVNVMGRETLPVSIKTSGKMPQRDGEIIEEVVMAPREIKVTYALQALTNEAFRIAYDSLKYHLMASREPVPIKFDDEPAYTYYGIVADVPEVDPGINTVVGEILIFCADPYKYAATTSISATGTVTYTPDGLSFPLRPVIQVTMVTAATKITVDNLTTGRHIILNGSYSPGDIIVIDVGGSNVTKNGGSIKSHLDFVESDFFRFLITANDQVKVTPADATIQLSYKRRLL